MMELAEIDLFEKMKQGDQSAFEMIFKNHYKPLCNYAFNFLRNSDEAEEIVQSTFLTVWEKKESITIESSLKAYLHRAVRNSCLNAKKHIKIKQKHSEETLHVAEHMYEGVLDSVITSELDEKIGAAIMVLPEQCRLVFKLSRFENLKYQEIADQLNISIKTVENQIGKALKIMREQLREYLPLLIIFINGFIN